MILLVGGLGAGKRAFAERCLGVGPACIADARDLEGPCAGVRVAVRAQELVRDRAPEEALRLLFDSRLDVVAIDEVGCGVVPVDDAERAWRERAGRLACLLAGRADTVVRLVCGLPQVIKGEL